MGLRILEVQDLSLGSKDSVVFRGVQCFSDGFGM